jgi:hypothetical protein
MQVRLGPLRASEVVLFTIASDSMCAAPAASGDLVHAENQLKSLQIFK